MTDYIANPTRHCQDSSIPVFLTHSQAKFVASKLHKVCFEQHVFLVEAAKQGMDKIWINADKNGKTVVESAQMSKGFKIIHEPWKINKGIRSLHKPSLYNSRSLLGRRRVEE